MPLAKASPALFSRYRDTRLRQVQPGTVIRELGLLHTIFETARRDWGYASFQNPLAGIRKPKAPDGRERRLKPGELQALTKASRVVSGSWLLHGFQLAIETGLRRGELLGIRWQDVNLDTAVLHVPFTKTDKARTIPLTDRAVELLKERKAASATDAEYAFPVSANAFRLAMQASCRASRLHRRAGAIASQFRTGMCWERYRQWEVDHVRPLSSARTLRELIALCHFNNLQPLWRGENLQKGGA
jgi:integrase